MGRRNPELEEKIRMLLKVKAQTLISLERQINKYKNVISIATLYMPDVYEDDNGKLHILENRI